MSQIANLIEFEGRYPKLYNILANGVPVYASLRDGVNFKLSGKDENAVSTKEQGRVSFRRIIDSFVKLRRFKNSKTAVFTSSVYRRDNGRNLAAEYLMDKYPDTVVFEWPSRNESFDFAYFKDKLKGKYCPLEYYVIYNKIYILLHKKEYGRLCDECRQELDVVFGDVDGDLPDNYRRAIDYLKAVMPDSYATNIMNQRVFKRLFKNYRTLEYAIDFWGSARENIIPVLPSKPESIELQHGLINSAHPGYIYPKFVADLNYDFFKRTILVYGEQTKKVLCDLSIFKPQQIEVIGNPRIIEYKNKFSLSSEDRKLILFTSQPYEQDLNINDYYSAMIPVLKYILGKLSADDYWSQYRLGIKLHPREDNSVKSLYEKEIKGVVVFDNTSQLYDLINKSYLHLTATSTTLYEATMFDVPTITIAYNGVKMTDNYGFETWHLNSIQDIDTLFTNITDIAIYQEYLKYLKEKTMKYM